MSHGQLALILDVVVGSMGFEFRLGALTCAVHNHPIIPMVVADSFARSERRREDFLIPGRGAFNLPYSRLVGQVTFRSWRRVPLKTGRSVSSPSPSSGERPSRSEPRRRSRRPRLAALDWEAGGYRLSDGARLELQHNR